jgi:hypothetical protein
VRRRRSSIDWELVGAIAGMLLAAGVVVVAIVAGGARVLTISACLHAGYPDGKVTWNLERFCVKRVDQTDVVVPLDEATR